MIHPPSHYRIESQLLPVTLYHTATTVYFDPAALAGPNQASNLQPEPIQAGGVGGQSEIIDIGGSMLAELQVPAGFTGAAITFLTQDAIKNWQSLRHPDGTEYVVVVTAGQNSLVTFLDFQAIDKIKIRSGTSASPVQQVTDSVISLRLFRQIE